MIEEVLKEKGEKIKELEEKLKLEEIPKLGNEVEKLYEKVNEINKIINGISNIPEEMELKRIEISQALNNWNFKIEDIEKDYNIYNLKNVGFRLSNVLVALVCLVGTSLISSVLGTGGSILRRLVKPIGYGIVCLYSGWSFLSARHEKEILENIFIKILDNSERKLKLGILEINERIKYIHADVELLEEFNNEILGYHKDYNNLTEIQKNRITNCVNIIIDSIKLITIPIKSLSQNFDDNDYINYKGNANDVKKKNLFILLANMLENVYLNEEERKILVKYILNNEDLFKNDDIRKENMTLELLNDVFDILAKNKIL